MPSTNYEAFPDFVLRTPLFPLNFFKNLTAEQDISDASFKELFALPAVREALFLATPELYSELEKWASHSLTDPKKIEKLRFSFLKYLTRMSSRCTPFGIFAGCAVGSLGDKTEIQLVEPTLNKRHTRLDMNYLVALSQSLVKIPHIRSQILYYPNSSVYKVGDKIRYVEFEYINGMRHHYIMGVDDSIYLEKVFEACKNGLRFDAIVTLLTDEENSAEEVAEFINELIEGQLLVTELEPSVSGPELMDQIINTLQKLQGTEPVLAILNSVAAKLLEIDGNIGNSTALYKEISVELEKLDTEFDIKYLFQTDVILNPDKNVLDDAIVAKVKRGLSIYNKATAPQTENLLSAFKTAFYERFEDEEVMLSKALDVEVGIGYKQNQHSLDINPLIDDIAFPAGPTNQASDIKWNRVNSIFHKKLVDAFVDSSYTITLSDTDFENFEENWDDLPYTLSTIIEIVNIDGKQKILLGSAGGSSGANLLGRFCHGDELMNNHANTIAKFESGYRNDKLFAEIVHLPESRVGNILTRPAFREFEIPYLAKSNLAFDKQLTIDDLRLSVKNNKVVLRSEKYDKEVIPRLTNAHNFHSNSLPIYHFLADLQTQGKRAYIGIQPGPLTEQYKFLPRVEYEDLIFCEAMWNFSSEDLKPLYTIENDLKLLEEIGLLRKKYKLPKFVSIADGDNELLINLENLTSLKMFLNTVKNRSSVKLKEFLHNEDGVVKHKGNSETFTNQFILSFFNTKN